MGRTLAFTCGYLNARHPDQERNAPATDLRDDQARTRINHARSAPSGERGRRYVPSLRRSSRANAAGAALYQSADLG